MSAQSHDARPPAQAEAIGNALYSLTGAAIRRASRRLSLTAVSTLSTLSRLGVKGVSDLAVLEGVAQPSMTVLVTNLERLEFVRREADPRDGRAVLVRLTEEGEAFLRARRSEGVQRFVALIDQLGDGDFRALLDAVRALEQLAGFDDSHALNGVAPGQKGSP